MSDEATPVERNSAAVRGWIEHKRRIYKVPPAPTLDELRALAQRIFEDLRASREWQNHMENLSEEERKAIKAECRES